MNCQQINNINNLEYIAYLKLKEWRQLICKQNYYQANELCLEFICEYKTILLQHLIGANEEKYNHILILLILFKGLQEYTIVSNILQDKNWHQDNRIIEEAWIKLCNIRDRLEFSLNYCKPEIIEVILYDIKKLKEFFVYLFSNFLYLSPGIRCKNYVCNICQKDTRSCNHIGGKFYNGKICYSEPISPLINHVAFVKVPKDPRCRIWPWNIKENSEGTTIEGVCVLTSFSVDDFLDESTESLCCIYVSIQLGTNTSLAFT